MRRVYTGRWKWKTLRRCAGHSLDSTPDVWLKPRYDRLGFRRVDPELTHDCATRVLFLGDSFTDGVGVNDNETFVNRYGHLVRERLRLSACPINAGVEGYGSLEES